MVEFFIGLHMVLAVSAILLLAVQTERRKIIAEKKKLAHLLVVAARGRRYR